MTGDLSRTGGAGSSWDAGASSTQLITGDGAVSFRFRDDPTPRSMVGLNKTDSNSSYTDLDYAVYLRFDREVHIYENGSQVVPGGGTAAWFDHYDETDVFTIERKGSEVFYLRNGQIFHKSTQAASGSYVVDTSFLWLNATIGDVVISTGDSGVARHVYDAQGQRVLRVDPDRSKTMYYGNTELRWAPGSSTVDAARTYPGGVRRDFDGGVTYNVTDHQGTVTATVDANAGSRDYVRYLPYGGLRDNGLVDDKGFLSQTHDPTTELIYLNNRHHDPTLGMFASVDPLVVQTVEPYIYGAANPIAYSDPSGLCVEAGSFAYNPDTGSYTYTPMGGPECYDARLDGHETSGKGEYAGGYGVSSVPGPVSSTGNPIPELLSLRDLVRKAVTAEGIKNITVAIIAGAVAARKCQTVIGCGLIGGLAGASSNVVLEEAQDCFAGSCLDWSVAEATDQVSEGLIIGGSAGLLNRELAYLLGMERGAIGIMGAVNEYGVRTSLQSVVSQAGSRISVALARFIYQQVVDGRLVAVHLPTGG